MYMRGSNFEINHVVQYNMYYQSRLVAYTSV